MSYSIYYKSMFVRLSDGTFIPMVESGDSNTYTCNKRSRDWCIKRPLMKEDEERYGRYAWTEQEIRNDLEQYIDDVKQRYVNQAKNWGKENEYWTYKEIEQKFSYFSGMTIYGNGGYTSAQQLRNFLSKGFERAIDMDGWLLEITYWKNGEYQRDTIECEEHLARRYQDLRAEGVKQIYFDYTIHGMLRYIEQDKKAKKPSTRQPRLHTTTISLKNAEQEPERVMNYRDYEKVAKVGERIILDGNGIISGFANASRSRSYKVVGSNDNGLLLAKFGGSKRLYVQDYYKDQRVAVLTAQEWDRLPY